MSYDLVVRARRAIVGGVESSCAIGVSAGRIAAIEPVDAALDTKAEITLADDEVLLPGLVDTHVHVNEPGRTEWEGFATATRAAAAGGVTTIVDMPLNSIPSTVTTDALDAKRKVARDQAHVDVGFWGGAVPGNLKDLAELHEAGVFGFKCFLIDSGVEEFPPLSPAEFAEAMDEIARLGALMIVHAEDPSVIDHAPPAHGSHYADFVASRPPAAEVSAIATVIAQARRTKARTHVLHLSAADALPELAAARADGVDISVETCPHYLSLSAEHVPDGATQFKCCPPIRGHANQDRLWEALSAGGIDMIVTDHSPCTVELKRFDSGDFGEAWGGIAGLQVGLRAVWTAARERGHTLADVVRWMATGTADRVGLTHKGRLAVGADADLVVFAPDVEHTVDVADLHHRNPVSAYAGSTLRGQVRQTWLRGRRIDDDPTPHGNLIERGRR